MAGVEIVLDGRMPKGHCEAVFRADTAHFVKEVVNGIQTNITHGDLCSSATDVIALYEDEEPQDMLYAEFQVL